MGNLCGAPGPRGSADDEQKNKDIDGEIKREKVRLDAEIKLLLLGAGESGKSTIAKQMKIIHLDGFSQEERESYRSIIASNTLGSMRVLVTAAADMGIELQSSNRDAAANILSDNAGFNGTLGASVARDIKQLWGDPAIRNVYNRSAEFQLNDSAGYYFDAIDRIAQPDYSPTEQDVLRSRTKTTGIIETEFGIEGVLFRMVDVGGQRSERKKWMYCFQDVTAVIFCVAMSEYDLKLYEDDTTNRMHESLKLFKEISNTKWFVNTAMILFLNKADLFKEKIRKVDLTAAFPDYTGGKNYENASEYIKKAFLAQTENPKKSVYSHFTCATDTQNVSVVFNAVKDIILNDTLTEAGMM